MSVLSLPTILAALAALKGGIPPFKAIPLTHRTCYFNYTVVRSIVRSACSNTVAIFQSLTSSLTIVCVFLHTPTGHMYTMGLASVLWLPFILMVLVLSGSISTKRSQQQQSTTIASMFAAKRSKPNGIAPGLSFEPVNDSHEWEADWVDLEQGRVDDQGTQAGSSEAQAGSNSLAPSSTPNYSNAQAGSSTQAGSRQVITVHVMQ